MVLALVSRAALKEIGSLSPGAEENDFDNAPQRVNFATIELYVGVCWVGIDSRRWSKFDSMTDASQPKWDR